MYNGRVDPRTYPICPVNLLPDYPLDSDEEFQLYAEHLDERERSSGGLHHGSLLAGRTRLARYARFVVFSL